MGVGFHCSQPAPPQYQHRQRRHRHHEQLPASTSSIGTLLTCSRCALSRNSAVALWIISQSCSEVRSAYPLPPPAGTDTGSTAAVGTGAGAGEAICLRACGAGRERCLSLTLFPQPGCSDGREAAVKFSGGGKHQKEVVGWKWGDSTKSMAEAGKRGTIAEAGGAGVRGLLPSVEVQQMWRFSRCGG